MYDEFYHEIKTNFVCFMDPDRYGRSIWENSSFIAPTNNPNRSLWGSGFVARLSGSTAEMLSMWHLMFFGPALFRMESGKLVFKAQPLLDGNFFPEDGMVRVRLFGKTEIEYHNPERINTYQAHVVKYEMYSSGHIQTVPADCVVSPLAESIRKGLFDKIKIYMEKKEEA